MTTALDTDFYSQSLPYPIALLERRLYTTVKALPGPNYWLIRTLEAGCWCLRPANDSPLRPKIVLVRKGLLGTADIRERWLFNQLISWKID